MAHTIISFVAIFMAAITLSVTLAAQQPPSPSDAKARAADATKPPVAARVDGQPVFAYEIEQALRRAFGDHELSAAQRAAWHRKALDQLVDQRLIVEFAKQRALVTDRQFQQSWKRLRETLDAQGLTILDYLRTTGRSEPELRHVLWYELAWPALLRHYQTDANLQRHFQRHRPQFDGTTLRVAQILFQHPTVPSAEASEALLIQANEVRDRIMQGQLPFAQAAKRYSQSPSAKKGGDIGWIERHRPMPEEFSRLAFSLEIGEVSEPVLTEVGIHVIQLLEIKPGTRDWTEVRPELEQAVQQYLFRWAADRQRPHCPVEVLLAEP